MPVYFGLPLNITEIMRLLNINVSECNNPKVIDKFGTFTYNGNDEHAKYLVITSHLKKNNSKMNIFTTDKGQYILGYRIHEIRDVWNDFTNVDKFIEILNELKNDFEEDINILNIDLFHVELERMENTSVYVNYPKPYIMEWSID